MSHDKKRGETINTGQIRRDFDVRRVPNFKRLTQSLAEPSEHEKSNQSGILENKPLLIVFSDENQPTFQRRKMPVKCRFVRNFKASSLKTAQQSRSGGPCVSVSLAKRDVPSRTPMTDSNQSSPRVMSKIACNHSRRKCKGSASLPICHTVNNNSENFLSSLRYIRPAISEERRDEKQTYPTSGSQPVFCAYLRLITKVSTAAWLSGLTFSIPSQETP
ncbi:MAG: hypothetical protein K5905_08195 [Roseibium sp.]|uniref:hypothetical protein n=1 Tax=Roseibium sp. TaxID=1936156 RepID=UPI0026278E50|nr:hypothetical protein [Roseibium sp.]MCV0425440.1 hypothetical protein [Roseibium sp.]